MMSYSLVLPQDFFYKCLISGMCVFVLQCHGRFLSLRFLLLSLRLLPPLPSSPLLSPVLDGKTKRH